MKEMLNLQIGNDGVWTLSRDDVEAISTGEPLLKRLSSTKSLALGVSLHEPRQQCQPRLLG